MQQQYGFVATVILAIITSGTLSALISGMFALSSQKKQEKNGLREGVRVLLYDRIKYLCKKAIKAGGITSDQLEDILSMHNVYHDLGGNGFLDSLIAQVKSLPIVHES